MSTTSQTQPAPTRPVRKPPAEDESFQYRALSRAALMSVVLGVLSPLGLVAPALLLLPILGLLLSWVALRNLRRLPHELSGGPLAYVGGVVSAAALAAGISFHSYVYAVEVPEGYQRISFGQLQPDPKSNEPVPESAKQLDGQRVFVAGYVHPDAGLAPVSQFVLVPDMGSCCFGGQPKVTDMIEVTLKGHDKVTYSMRKRKLAGKLRVDSRLKLVGEKLGGVYYRLEVDQIVR